MAMSRCGPWDCTGRKARIASFPPRRCVTRSLVKRTHTPSTRVRSGQVQAPADGAGDIDWDDREAFFHMSHSAARDCGK